MRNVRRSAIGAVHLTAPAQLNRTKAVKIGQRVRGYLDTEIIDVEGMSVSDIRSAMHLPPANDSEPAGLSNTIGMAVVKLDAQYVL